MLRGIHLVREPAVTDPLRRYADLYHQAVEARRRVDEIRLLLARAAEALEKRPERFRFDALDANGLPSWLTEAFAPAADWPTAEQIQRALAEWHSTADRLLDAWETLWPRDREMLAKSPPESAQIPRSPGYTSR